jgi:gluconolactonase
MKARRMLHVVIAALALASLAAAQGAPAGKPEAVIDLAMRDGVALVKGQWRYSDTKIVDVDFRGPGPDGQPTGAPVKTYDYTPKAGGTDFDDSQWEAIPADSLSRRRGFGRLGFNWYRIRVTIPDRIGAYSTAGKTVVFETALDDYAEIWVDGELPRALGQMGGSVVSGWNAPNRLVIARDVRAGQQIQLAIFGINGPLSNPPTNFIWMRHARLEFYPTETRGPIAVTPQEVNVEVLRLDPRMDDIVGLNPKLFKLAEGFQFTEGPVWAPDGEYLLFSDPNANTIYRYTKAGELSVFRTPSGYNGADIAEYRQPGSNGLTFDVQGRLTIDQHGNRRVIRLEADGSETVLADRFAGKRLNSPNDLVYRSDGALFFTDPFFGLPKFGADPRRELPFTGVFSLYNGKLQAVVTDLTGPNGIAFSPDEQFLYVGNWDDHRKVVMRYEVTRDAKLINGKVFFDMTFAPGEDAIDGIKVDVEGNLYVSGPGGLWVLSPDGKHLGTIVAPRHVHNMAWGDDGKTLYLCARDRLYRLPLRIAGVHPASGVRVPTYRIERLDPRFDKLVPRDAKLETIVEGQVWVEGPVWRAQSSSLLFSDIPQNSIFEWTPGQGVKLFLKPSGYSGREPFAGREPGSNGLALDAEGRLVLAEHGDRRITRLNADKARTVFADRYQGKRLNSPNDLVFRSNGDLYFTDPPFGLPGTFDDPAKELPFQGVYRLSADGALTLLTSELKAPNGIAFSPDEKTLYVTDVSPGTSTWRAYPVRADGTLGPGRVFADATQFRANGPGGPDGLKVDRDGNLFASGPGGLYVFAPDGTHLGSILTGKATSNAAWGEDGRTLFITGGNMVYRIRLTTKGAGH